MEDEEAVKEPVVKFEGAFDALDNLTDLYIIPDLLVDEKHLYAEWREDGELKRVTLYKGDEMPEALTTTREYLESAVARIHREQEQECNTIHSYENDIAGFYHGYDAGCVLDYR